LLKLDIINPGASETYRYAPGLFLLLNQEGYVMTNNTVIVNRWHGYYVEDCDCSLCLHKKGTKTQSCKLENCCCGEERFDAFINNRIERKRGLMQWDG